MNDDWMKDLIEQANAQQALYRKMTAQHQFDTEQMQAALGLDRGMNELLRQYNDTHMQLASGAAQFASMILPEVTAEFPTIPVPPNDVQYRQFIRRLDRRPDELRELRDRVRRLEQDALNRNMAPEQDQPAPRPRDPEDE